MTTYSDDFNRANSTTTLGSTSVGSALWTYPDGSTWGINSNTAYSPSSGAVAAVACAGDVTMNVTLATLGASTGLGMCFRLSDGSHFWAVICQTSGNPGLYKVSPGFTRIATFSSQPAQGDVVGVVASGTSITVTKNGTTIATATDSFNQTAIYAGLYTQTNANGRLDDFSVTFTPPVLTDVPYLLSPRGFF